MLADLGSCTSIDYFPSNNNASSKISTFRNLEILGTSVARTSTDFKVILKQILYV